MPYADKTDALAYARQWTRQKEARWHEAGNCITCGVPAGVNPHTGKPFHRCFDHRRDQSARQQAYKRRRAQRQEAA